MLQSAFSSTSHCGVFGMCKVRLAFPDRLTCSHVKCIFCEGLSPKENVIGDFSLSGGIKTQMEEYWLLISEFRQIWVKFVTWLTTILKLQDICISRFFSQEKTSDTLETYAKVSFCSQFNLWEMIELWESDFFLSLRAGMIWNSHCQLQVFRNITMIYSILKSYYSYSYPNCKS